MAKGAYIGVGGKAHKIRKGYIGVAGKARKIKKAYIGIGGKARPCWSGGELTYYGTITPLSKATYLLAATTIGNYALFAGGNDIGTVNAYDDSLTKENPSELSPYRCDLAATAIGNYALFGGKPPQAAISKSRVRLHLAELRKREPELL